MGGGILQLAAFGSQDIYLTGNPQITFFKLVYRRHTNFAMESIEQTFNGTVDFGRQVTTTIARTGDLITNIWLEITLPDLAEYTANPANATDVKYVNSIGHALLKTVELEVGGFRIDKHHAEWMDIWHELSLKEEKRAGFNQMIGKHPQYDNADPNRSDRGGRTYYIPLLFYFCRNPGLALPIISLQYHEVKVNIEFRPYLECLKSSGAAVTSVAKAGNPLQFVNAKIFVDYVYLDQEERRRFSQVAHEYLVEQVQFLGDQAVLSTTLNPKVSLNFSHPVKELVWVVQRDSFVDCTPNANFIAEVAGCQPFNYSDDFTTEGIVMDVLARGSLGGGGSGTAVPTTSGDGPSGPYLPGVGIAVGPSLQGASWLDTTAGVGDAEEVFAATTNYLLAKVILDSGIKCSGKNPVEVAKLQLNGQDRFTEREGRYFDRVQPYQHHTRTPTPGINVYSFALKPEEHQPSGTCNFSRIDKATLQLTVSVNTVRSGRTAQVRVYAVNYNVLRVMSGMGGLAYSN